MGLVGLTYTLKQMYDCTAIWVEYEPTNKNELNDENIRPTFGRTLRKSDSGVVLRDERCTKSDVLAYGSVLRWR